MLKLEWSCDQCKKMVLRQTLESNDMYDVYPPDGLTWVYERGKDPEQQHLCDDCHEKWIRKLREENPNAVGLADPWKGF